MSGSRPQAAVAPPGPAENVCVSSMISRLPAAPGELAQPLEEPVVGQHDPDVGQGRLGEHRRHVAVGQCRFDRREVVPRHHPRGGVERHRRADVARARHGVAVGADDGEGLVDRAVVAVLEAEDLGPAGGQPGEPDRPAVRVGGAQRERPERPPEAPGQLGADPLGVLGGQHRGDAAELAGPLLDRRHGGRGGVSGHRPGVPEREVDVRDPVHVGDPVAVRPVEVEREPAGPHVHPGHRHPSEQVPSPCVRRRAARVSVGVRRSLGREQLGDTTAVGSGHARLLGRVRRRVPRWGHPGRSANPVTSGQVPAWSCQTSALLLADRWRRQVEVGHG